LPIHFFRNQSEKSRNTLKKKEVFRLPFSNNELTSSGWKNYLTTVVSAGAAAAVSTVACTAVVSAVASALVSPDLHDANEKRPATASKNNSFFMCCLF
jgi:hypothetical protein